MPKGNTGTVDRSRMSLSIVDTIISEDSEICHATANQIKLLFEKRDKMATINSMALAKEKQLEKKAKKIRDLQRDLNYKEDKATVRRLRKMSDVLTDQYNAVLETILLDFEPEVEFSDKLEMIARIAGNGQKMLESGNGK
jgi:hypothetical protein